MKMGLYQDPRGAAIGGGEYCLAVLARALCAEGHSVDLIHHQGARFVERLSDFFRIDLTGIGQRDIPAPGRWDASDVAAYKRGAAIKGWMRDVSEPYDVFVCMTHTPPPFNHARIGILYIHFPFFDRRDNWPWNAAEQGLGQIKAWWRKRVYERWWHERMNSYYAIASNSEFTRGWTQKYWGVDSTAVFPPVDLSKFIVGEKQDRILVLGRFTQVKKQAELIAVFKKHRSRLPGWSFNCIGGLSEDNSADLEYFDVVGREASGVAELTINAPRVQVHSELSRSRIFWHGMGIDVDETRQPMKIEHFGIATVEAMAAGCIPIVVNQGGQREIVTHGETGFLCNSLEEFAERTIEISADPTRSAKMASAARDHAAQFASSIFEDRMLAILRPHLTGTGEALWI